MVEGESVGAALTPDGAATRQCTCLVIPHCRNAERSAMLTCIHGAAAGPASFLLGCLEVGAAKTDDPCVRLHRSGRDIEQRPQAVANRCMLQQRYEGCTSNRVLYLYILTCSSNDNVSGENHNNQRNSKELLAKFKRPRQVHVATTEACVLEGRS